MGIFYWFITINRYSGTKIVESLKTPLDTIWQTHTFHRIWLKIVIEIPGDSFVYRSTKTVSQWATFYEDFIIRIFALSVSAKTISNQTRVKSIVIKFSSCGIYYCYDLAVHNLSTYIELNSFHKGRVWWWKFEKKIIHFIKISDPCRIKLR